MSSALIMVTGHRPVGIGGYKTPNPTEQWVRANIEAALQGYLRRFDSVSALTGMALGADQIYAEVAIKLGITLHAALPFKGHESQWPERSKAHYRRLLEQCTGVVTVCEPGYAKWKMWERNKYMVGQATHAIAVWNGGPSGTGHAVNLLRQVGTPTLWLDPTDHTVQPITATSGY